MSRQLGLRARIVILCLQLLTVAMLLIGWQYVGSGSRGGLLFSTPTAVATQLATWFTDSVRYVDVLATVEEAAGGFVIGTVAAVLAAIALGASRTVGRFATPFVAALNGIPKIALGPLYLLLFGIGTASKIYFVATVVFFIPFYNIFMSIRSIDQTLVDNIKILGASPRWLLVDIYVPALAGVLVSSFRLTASWAMLSAVVGEMLASSNGIGYVINQGQHLLENDVVLAGVIVVSLIVFVFDRLFVLVERVARRRTS